MKANEKETVFSGDLKSKYGYDVITKTEIAKSFNEISLNLTETGLRHEIHKLIKNGSMQSVWPRLIILTKLPNY